MKSITNIQKGDVFLFLNELNIYTVTWCKLYEDLIYLECSDYRKSKNYAFQLTEEQFNSEYITFFENMQEIKIKFPEILI